MSRSKLRALKVVAVIFCSLLALAVSGAIWYFRTNAVTCQAVTGDAMLDEYLALSIRHSLTDRGGSSLLTSAEWEMLEKKYSETPEFALLCKSGCRTVSTIDWTTSGQQQGESWDDLACMERVYKAGRYNMALLAALYLQRYTKWSGQQKEPAPSKPYSRMDRARDWQTQHQAMYRAHKEAQDKLLSDMRFCAPDQAYPYYLHAFHACGLGEYELAAAYLRQGNAAPHCDLPCSKLSSFYFHATRQGQVLGDDPFLSGIISQNCNASYALLDMKYSAELMTHEAITRRDPQLLKGLNQALCRLGTTDACDDILLIALGLAFKTISETALPAYGQQPTAVQQAAMDQYKTKVSQLEREQGILQTMENQELMELNRVEPAIEQLLDRFSLYRMNNVRIGRIAGEAEIAKLRHYEQRIKPLFADLSRFDFATLSWPKSAGGWEESAGKEPVVTAPPG